MTYTDGVFKIHNGEELVYEGDKLYADLMEAYIITNDAEAAGMEYLDHTEDEIYLVHHTNEEYTLDRRHYTFGDVDSFKKVQPKHPVG